VSRRPTLARLIAWLLLLGPVAGVAAYSVALRNERRRAIARFETTMKDRAADLEHEVYVAQAAVATLATVMSAFPAMTLDHFVELSRDLRVRYAGIIALEWAPRVTAAERQRFEEATRARGLGRFAITEQLASGALAPARPRPEYYPVTFLEPLLGNHRALGFDLGSETTRLAALQLAVRRSGPTLSDPVHLVQGDGAGLGLLLFVPVPCHPPAPTSAPVAAPRGFAVGVLTLDQLAARSLNPNDVSTPLEAAFELLDQDVGGRHALVFSNLAQSPGVTRLASVEPWRHEMTLFGQHWLLVARPSQAYLTAETGRYPFVLGVGSFLGYELLVVLGLVLHRWSVERKRRRETDLVNSVLASIPQGVLVADTSGHIVVANPAARRILGSRQKTTDSSQWSRAYGLYSPQSDTLFPDEQLPLARALRGEAVFDVELLVRNDRVPGGAWVSVSAAPIVTRAGERVGGVTVFRDITESRLANELFHRLNSAVEQTSDTVFMTDRDGVILYVNPAFEITTGYSRAEAIGQTPRLLKSGKQSADYYTHLWAALRRGEGLKATVINQRKNGEHFHAEQTITPIKDSQTGEVTCFVSVLRDMTEHLQLREREIEMRVGAAVQRRLFPQIAPVVEGFDISGAVSPALATCGDYYDFIAMPDGRVMLVIADVCGHGLGSALIMAETRAYLHSVASVGVGLNEVAARLNTFLLSDLPERFFVTMFLALLDSRSGTLEWLNLGHPSGLVLAESGNLVDVLRSTCKPLGMFPVLQCPVLAPTAQVPYRPTLPEPGVTRRRHDGSVALAPGDVLVLLTDGVIETSSPEDHDFGVARVIEAVSSSIDCSAKEIAHRVIDAARTFSGELPQTDDLTVLVCKRAGHSSTEPH
jgi:PAS domain S-box-containing protein